MFRRSKISKKSSKLLYPNNYRTKDTRNLRWAELRLTKEEVGSGSNQKHRTQSAMDVSSPALPVITDNFPVGRCKRTLDQAKLVWGAVLTRVFARSSRFEQGCNRCTDIECMSGPVAEYADRHFLKRLLRARTHGEFDFPILVSFSSSDASLTDQVEELYELG